MLGREAQGNGKDFYIFSLTFHIFVKYIKVFLNVYISKYIYPKCLYIDKCSLISRYRKKAIGFQWSSIKEFSCLSVSISKTN